MMPREIAAFGPGYRMLLVLVAFCITGCASQDPVNRAPLPRMGPASATGPVAGQTWVSPVSGMEFVWVPALKIWVGRYEVTNRDYRLYKPTHHSRDFARFSLNGDRQPVVKISFDDARRFAEWLTFQDGPDLHGARYRLPAEAEWLVYCRCGDQRRYPWGNGWPPTSGNYLAREDAGEFSKIHDYYDGHPVTCAVEKSGANAWGLYGVGGNVAEACAADATGQAFGAWHGMGWYISDPEQLRCDDRDIYDIKSRFDGFRLVLSR